MLTKDLNISKSTIPDSLMQQIKKMIINKKLKPGEALPSQRKMAAELGVGVPSIREALKIMEGMGLVKIQHGHSTIITQISMDSLITNITTFLEITEVDVLHLLETKDFIETQCALVAATRATESEIKELENYIKAMEKYFLDSQKYAQLDYLFHLTIVKAAHNPIINEIMKMAGRMILKGMEITSSLPGRDIAMDYHRRIFEAIRDRNGILAATLIHEHIAETAKRYKNANNSGENVKNH
jgi:GntR family transcriptional repressor for pyruvate dehydrogenase complex